MAQPFTVLPPSVFDLSTYDLTPVFSFPGEGPSQFQCGVYNRVDVTLATHDAGGVTDKDVALAHFMDQAAAAFKE